MRVVKAKWYGMWIYVLAGIKLVILQNILFEVLITTIIVEIDGNSFQLSNNGNITR